MASITGCNEDKDKDAMVEGFMKDSHLIIAAGRARYCRRPTACLKALHISLLLVRGNERSLRNSGTAHHHIICGPIIRYASIYRLL
jgi:hypothetical protein